MSFDVKATIAEGRKILSELPGILDSALIGSATYMSDPSDVDFATIR